MKKALLVSIYVLLLPIGILAGAAEKDIYGEGVSGCETIAIAAIIANPDDYNGKTVRVRGKVVDVCRHQGCWLDLQDPSGSEIQLKVDDGVIVFPPSAIGKEAVAEGKVEVRELSKEQYTQLLTHQAEEQGRRFDPAEVGQPPFRYVRIKGTGAEIRK